LLTTRLLFLALLARSHPIHSSSAQVTLPEGSGNLTVMLRVFADDFPPGRVIERVMPYLAHRFRLEDARGQPVALHLDTVREEGVVLILSLSAPVGGALRGGRIWHGVLGERFADQVNLVQVHRGPHSVTLLFTATDGPKALP
jgi:hypothetical protein